MMTHCCPRFYTTCGVGLTIAPLQNPYNLSLPLNPYGVLQQVTFYCNTFNNGNIGFIGCGEVPVHGSLSNGAGNEFSNLNIANGIWAGLDTLEYYFFGTAENPRPTFQPTQIILCNSETIGNWPKNNINNQPSGASLCGSAPSPLANSRQIPSFKRDHLVIYPNPTFDGLVYVRPRTTGVINYRITSTNGITFSEGKLRPSEAEIIFPANAGIYLVYIYINDSLVDVYKVIRL